ncbi:MAG TPA: ImmA/IrrE family metallo-endopeptidase [Pyrinomonadaceae bacterium]|nr:ImmA/IrrE family metallo-endopeptidase [Pyrinomonadaceae bacterium]
MIRVEIKPELLSWARQRAGYDLDALAHRFPKLTAWEQGTAKPTLRQVEKFAAATHTPVGFLFLQEPPVETIPIPDFRTVRNKRLSRPSPDLLDMIYVCQQRQEWYRDFARSQRESSLSFVGSVSLKSSVEETAESMRNALDFDIEERRQLPTWTDALRRFIEQADGMGIVVMCSGVVLNNNTRRLDADEFRGFALADDLAPLVFINGADTKAAQMFTLAHELAHIWLGQSAVSDAQALQVSEHEVERWCNRVAAELLVPLAILRQEYRDQSELQAEINRLAKRFKVSTLVILRRIHDAGGLTQHEFWRAYEQELERLLAIAKGSGGNFYLTQAARVSKRFARALVISTLEGQTLHRDAFRMLGFAKLETFKKLGRSLGVMA